MPLGAALLRGRREYIDAYREQLLADAGGAPHADVVQADQDGIALAVGHVVDADVPRLVEPLAQRRRREALQWPPRAVHVAGDIN